MRPVPKLFIRLLSEVREHRQFLIVATILTLVLTFPTVIYVFRTDVFWTPTGSENDAYIKFWDIWYGRQFLAGEADRFFTDLMFYPTGLSLTHHPFYIPYIILVNLLSVFLPVSNVFSLVYLLITFSAAISAYLYLTWLFKDKRTALFGAVVFGFSPHVIGHPHHPDIASVAMVPLVLYCLHRGVEERRTALVILAGLLTGLSTVVSIYMYISIVLTLGMYVCALAISRWRDKRFLLSVLALALAIAVSSVWRVYPLMTAVEPSGEIIGWHGETETRLDAISYIINHRHPILGPLADTIFQTPKSAQESETSYLGYLPLLLIGLALATASTRRAMLPWALLCAIFLTLRLGSHLNVNGTLFAEIKLPKFYLDQIPSGIFDAFWEADHFMMGALLPFAVLVCYGLIALQSRFPAATKPIVVLGLVAIVAFEYYIPVQDNLIRDEELAFLDWLKQENEQDGIRLINVPMGRYSAKKYNYFQSLTGYPAVEGAISRTPDSAFDYIRSNHLLNSWLWYRPIACGIVEIDDYLLSMEQLAEDGFSHVVFHRKGRSADRMIESFRDAKPSYEDDYTWIFRLSDLRAGCPLDMSVEHPFTWAYVKALHQPSVIHERPATIVVFAPTPQASGHFISQLRPHSPVNRSVVALASGDEGEIDLQSIDSLSGDAIVDLESEVVVWLFNVRAHTTEGQTEAQAAWFSKRFEFCARFHEGENTNIDLYVRIGVPCEVFGAGSDIDARYDDGLRLRNFYYDSSGNLARFYLSWTLDSRVDYGFSIQFFDDEANKALQYDDVIRPELLSIHEIDAEALPAGVYSLQLIVYDYETRISQGGTLSATGERFERALDIGELEIGP